MNILILGSGIVGANLANKLSDQGKNVFVLDDDPNSSINLSPKESTNGDGSNVNPDKSSSGGAIGWFVLPLALLGFKRRRTV